MLSIKMINEGGTFELTSLKTVINRRLIIPSYQRAYAWDENNIEDLFNTIKEGFLEISDNDETQPIFFGSVIFSQKNENTYLIIDGQQRVTTFLFILRMVQEMIEQKKVYVREHLSRLDKEEQEHFDKKDRANIKRVNQRIKESEKKLDSYNSLIDRVEKILEVTHISRESAANQISMESEYLNYITRKKYNSSKDLEKNKSTILKHIESLMEDLVFSSLYEKYNYIIDFILSKVKFCILNIDGSNSEEYAIDVFNTLNSTGEPLTGFEVLKSTLIQIIRSSDQKQDMESRLFDLENAIKKYKPTRKDRNRQKGKLLLYLAIHRNDYDKGKLSDKKFKDQNEYIKKILRQDCSKEGNIQEQIALNILKDMEKLNQFVTLNWLPKKNVERAYTKELKPKQDVLALKGFDFLININHDRVIPIIYKYSRSCLEGDFNLKNYKKIIEFCTSFSCLWRMAFHGGAAGIDAEYLKIAESLNSKASIDQARIILMDRLKEKFSSKEDWMEKLLQSEVSKNKKLTQFLLALITLKNLFSFHSSDWQSAQMPSGGNKNLFGSVILVKKDVYSKYVKTTSKIDKKYLDSNTYNMDVVDLYFNENSSQRIKKFGGLIWKKLAEDTLGYK